MIKKYIISAYRDILPLIMALFIANALDIVIIEVPVVANEKLNKQHRNKLMCLKVLLQAISIVFFCDYRLVGQKLRFF
tara:strand:- start:124 stop:357 length:234 start_codon:yes stop_codon:yes gene_type:complete